ncbi:2'-5' RNA ligase [Marivirga sericea]|uniref:2'-5' RNA ligase n=1 Tax=Marivirga sericea TaxID=1028 RepID=A0A1X7J1V2_9BACT|nr:2'-5' RNA ligase family protein [Marivirga sericea]SMG21317.1 2'-5' RNA ligase [Marivirga sericea]
MEKSSFFIGICPPHLLEQEIHRIKEELRQKYGIQGAFRSKAHITLQMPFNLPIKRQEDFLKDLMAYLRNQKAFDVQLDDFGNFEPRVIYINVQENTALNALQESVERFMKGFQVFNGTHKNNGFNPHITVAFRDLKKQTFYNIWDEVKNREFREVFTARSVVIFKHNGKSWDIFKELKLEGL